jgi:hypothetical protein
MCCFTYVRSCTTDIADWPLNNNRQELLAFSQNLRAVISLGSHSRQMACVQNNCWRLWSWALVRDSCESLPFPSSSELSSQHTTWLVTVKLCFTHTHTHTHTHTMWVVFSYSLQSPDRFWGPPSLLSRGFRLVKRPVRGADHSPTICFRGQKWRSYTYTPPCLHSVTLMRTTFL